MENNPIFYTSDSGFLINLLEISCIKPYKPPCDYGSELKLSDGTKIMLNWGEREKIAELLIKKGLCYNVN